MAVRLQGKEEKGLGAALRSAPEFVNQVKTETGKVAWPTRRETLTTAVMVVLMTFILGLFFFGVDAGFNALAKLLLGLVS